MKLWRSILVGVDFTRSSQNALREALRLAHDCSVNVVHVIDQAAIDDLRQSMPDEPDVEGRVKAEAGQRMAELVAGLNASECRIDSEVLFGNPAQVLLDRSAQLGTDLLVLARNSNSDPSGGAGAYALRCVRHATMDVLLVREDHAGPYLRIAACVDFSSNAEFAADIAARIAQHDGAHLDLLHAYVPPWDVAPFAAMPAIASLSYQSDYLELLQKRLAKLKDTLAARHGDGRIAQLIEPAGSVGSSLVSVMEQIKTDLAVLGTHGRGRLERLLLGSTAERIIRNAHCSVLTVRGKARQESDEVTE